MKMCSAMSSPFEHREVMKAHFRMGGETRTVEEVLADQKRRHEQRAETRRSNKPGKKAPTKSPRHGTPKQDQVDLLAALLQRGKPKG